MKNIKRGRTIIAAILCASALASCNNKDSGPEIAPSQGGIVFNFPVDAPTYILPNIETYVFDNASKTFEGKLLGVTKTDNVLTGKFQVGTWETILLSRSDIGTGSIIQPSKGNPMSTTAMWKTLPSGDGYLPQIPELFYGSTGAKTIVADMVTQAEATLVRNMAKVTVVVEEAYGFDLIKPENKIILSNVPTTLSWAGKLMPNAATPLMGSMAMSPVFAEITEDGKTFLRSTPMDFIIPAHRGADWSSASPTDTTTLKLHLNASLFRIGEPTPTMYPEDRPYAEIVVTPKMNKILLVRVKIKGMIEVESIVVTPWTIVDTSPIIN